MFAWIWGGLAFIVFCGFPGFLMRHRFRSLSWVETVALSMGVNAFLVLLLNLGGIYYRGVICGYVLVAFGLLAHKLVRNMRVGPPVWLNERMLPWLALLPMLILVFYLTFFFPFLQYDAIASWNRWAVVFANGPDYLRQTRWFYPQFLPFSYSFIYKAAGNTNITPLAHGLAFIHMLLFIGAVAELSLRMGLRTRAAMGLPFLCFPFAQHVAAGNADIPSAAFSAIAACVLLRAESDRRLLHFGCRCAFAGWLAAVGLLHKQMGVIPFLVLPLAWQLTASGRERKRHAMGAAIFFAVGVMSLLPWTLWAADWFENRFIVYLTQTIYGNMTWGQRVLQAFASLGNEFTVAASHTLNVVLAVVACACALIAMFVRPRTRMLFITALAVLLGCVMFFSYDSRNLMAMVPLFCVSVVAGGELLIGWLCKLGARSWQVAGLLATIAFAGIGAAYQMQWPTPASWQWSYISAAFTVRAFAGSQEKLTVFIPEYADLQAWESAYPLRAPLQYWLTDPRLCALAQHGIYKRFDGFLDNLAFIKSEALSRYSWRKGDILLVKTADIAHRVFLDKHLAIGRIKRLDQIGCFTGYQVLDNHVY
jgi:hypothetical protein